MPAKHMTYAELAAVWAISPEAARKKVEGLRLPRQPGNDGKTRVLIDLEEVQHRPKPKSDRRAAGDHLETEALQRHITTLQAEIDRLTTLANANRADFEVERRRAEAAISELVALTSKHSASEQDRAERLLDLERARTEIKDTNAIAEQARAELEAWKAKPWWRRALG